MSLADSSKLIRGRADAARRRTAGYRQALEGCDVVSQQMAIIIVKDALRAYRRKVVSPDELTHSLFASTSDRQIEDHIAGIQREVSRYEFLPTSSSKFPIRAGDRFYPYTTIFGGGYVVARDGKVIKDEWAFDY